MKSLRFQPSKLAARFNSREAPLAFAVMEASNPPTPSRVSRLLDQAWSRGWATKPSLDPEHIVASAYRRERGNAKEGPWQARLDLLCRSLRDEADLNAFGLTAAYVQLIKLVRARVRADRLLAEQPAIADRALASPVVIVGQMRSGTTRIHRLLACDRRFAVNRMFEQLDPVPYPQQFDPRLLAAAATSMGMRLGNPSLMAIHPSAPKAAEEDFGLHAFSIWGALFEGQWRVPGFARHVEQADPSDVYREFATLLRISSIHREIAPERPWLLKAPQFAQELDALLHQFPDARLIVLRRPNEQLVASGASLVWQHSRIQSDTVTREEVGHEWLRKTKLRSDRMEAALERSPDVPIVSLDYAEVSRDWRAPIGSIYDMLGWELGSETEARMARFIDRSTVHQGHRYALEDFGLDRTAVAAAFG